MAGVVAGERRGRGEHQRAHGTGLESREGPEVIQRRIDQR